VELITLYIGRSETRSVLPLYPETKRFLELLPAADPEKIGVDGFRRQFRALTSFLPKEKVDHVDDVKIDGSEREVPARVYHPSSAKDQGGVVYFHGGGFVIGDVESYDPFCRTLANASQSVIFSIDYRLAPEHKFPAAVTDAFDSVNWALKNASKFGVTKGIAVAGDSAGGNLAAVSALMCRDRGMDLKAQILIFPFTCVDFTSRSSIEYAETFFLTRKAGRWFSSQYLSKPEDALNPKFSPVLWNNYAGLTPCLMMTAEYDPLRDQGEAYADMLASSGVPVTSLRVRGVTHGFIGLPSIGGDSYAMIGGYLKRRFRTY
jgi:acetyl esterase/lipase